MSLDNNCLGTMALDKYTLRSFPQRPWALVSSIY